MEPLLYLPGIHLNVATRRRPYVVTGASSSIGLSMTGTVLANGDIVYPFVSLGPTGYSSICRRRASVAGTRAPSNERDINLRLHDDTHKVSQLTLSNCTNCSW